MGRRRRKCRLWWPRNLLSPSSPNSSFLFGWFIPNPEESVDVVVAFTCDEPELTSLMGHCSNLQEVLLGTTESMTPLQDKSEFHLLGLCEANASGNGVSVRFKKSDKNDDINSTNGQHPRKCTSDHVSWNCGCSKKVSVFKRGKFSAQENMWIRLIYSPYETADGKVLVIPKLDHLHMDSETMSHLDLHVILYDIPTFGGHHYSLGSHSLSNPVQSTYRKPKWFDDLQQKNVRLDLDTVIQAMNSACAARILFDGHQQSKSGFPNYCRMVSTVTWKLFATCVASLSTVIFIIIQSSRVLFGWFSRMYMDVLLENAFSNTSKNIHFRCCQLLYWPLSLQDQSIRDWSSVEVAEKVSFDKHSIWSNVMVDILLGNIFGITLWFMAEPACSWVSKFSQDFTNNWLRTGCVWLMGNPAGFKLNTELAGILGMICLNAIQIWSTLWSFMGFLFVYFTKGLALCGVVFGLTSAAALIVDVISLVTMHVLSLHLFFSFIYSSQIRALAALWRLFSGRKVNPQRHRLDSYDHSVEQHVVGSLLFTPILLLLPTISAFHIFFTILHTTVTLICIFIEAVISFIHFTPYAKVFIWLRSKSRFPCGIWFETTACQHSEFRAVNGGNLSSEKLRKADYASSSHGSSVLVSFLHSNYLNLGEVVKPHYRLCWSSFSRSSIGSSAYGLLTGRSILYSPGPTLPAKLPWIVIPLKEYWHICRNSVYACLEDRLNLWRF
ncbi:N-acetylglucosaminyl transferase component family protein / Gpi1 family protein [Striga hermonthica]|uniref:N-acetylglucosaminyl transferase component family protein / Gpi1 family protein n=1 Tax=Striga hermonthica TaxID=68872 RepID=A0A9N7NFW9_STRHE|nr:N-acetylglucosaminyl transferase component family protein / Gpi1 family protein [Striga hermonthica]